MRYFYFLFFCFLFGCDSVCPPNPPLSDVALVHLVTEKVVKKLRHENQLRACGFGARMLGPIKRLGLSFLYYKSIDVEEARSLIVTAVDSYLQAVNEEQRIHPYLETSPFQPKNIEIRIFIRNPDGSFPPPDRITYVGSLDGEVSYEIFSPENNQSIKVHRETYEEAKQRLREHKNSHCDEGSSS